MKHFSKQLSWLLAFALIFTSIVSIGIPVYASDTITIGESTDEVILAGTNVELGFYAQINIKYYESADSETVLYEDTHAYKIGSDDIAIETYAWHIKYVDKWVDLSGTEGNYKCYFKAYPDTSLENVPASTTMTLPEGTTLTATTTTTTSDAINVSVYVEDAKLTDYSASSSFILPSASELRSNVGETEFNSALTTNGYNLPDLTKLYYTVELTDKSTTSYSLKLTLVPTVEVTFDENTGTPDLAGTIMYATPYATIDSTKLPTVSLDGVDFYGWKKPSESYVSLANVTDANRSVLSPMVSLAYELKAMYKEKNPTFKLDLANKKVTNLLRSRTYAYPEFNWSTRDYTAIPANASGEISYERLEDFTFWAELRLNSQDPNVSLNSEYVSLKHETPTAPLLEVTDTTITITNTEDYAGCEFNISGGNYQDSPSFTGLTPETEYKIYVKHLADENGFESLSTNSNASTTSAVKTVSNEAPNGVAITDIPDQAHTSSAIEPTLMIKDGDKTLVLGTDYAVAYSDNINVGTATATVTFINGYSGTMTKSFTISHNWKTDWSSDENNHWHECSGCHEKNDEAAHIPGAAATAITPQTCTECGYILVPTLGSWLVSFDGNGGTGAMSNVSVINGGQYTLPSCTFTAPANKEFKAWNIGGTEYVAGANYTITADTTVTAVWKDLEKVKTPAISPNGGTFSSSQTITLTTETPDAIIYYTTDGTDPTTESTLYSQPFIISSSTTVKVIAVKGGMINSDIASVSFTKLSSSSSSSSNTPPPPPVITVSDVTSELFDDAEDIKVEADVTSAFGQSVEVRITDNTDSQNEIFSLAGANEEVYPFDISLYSRESKQKVQPRDGYSVKLTIPVPEKLLEDREQIKVVYGKDGKLETLKSELIEKDGKWYIIFEATHFSPYALVVSVKPEPSVSWTNPFSDVKEGDWYYSAVQHVAQNGLMFGTGNNIFSPQLTTNRGMIATILYRLSSSSETLQSTFKDVITGAYYTNAVAWAEKNGIIAGYGNGMFGPEDSITREQMATILWRYAGSPVPADSNGLAAFKDAVEISSYAKNALVWAHQQGILAGKGNGILDPKGYATRAEVAQIIFNFAQKADLTE